MILPKRREKNVFLDGQVGLVGGGRGGKGRKILSKNVKDGKGFWWPAPGGKASHQKGHT